MSSKQNILFRADSSSSIGIGHIMRDLVLAKQFEDSNIYFASLELEGNIINRIPYRVIRLNGNTLQELNSLIKELDIDMIVIDHYGIDYEFEKKLKTNNSKLKILSLDDTYKKHHCDILLNHNISADKKKYKDLVPKSCELRCGSKYTLLRDEFIEEKENKRRVKNSKVRTVFVAMGGADHSNINIKILKVLEKFD
ncbi:MAG: UDP-2,4-diacetamido-2,4,6-trideoxy-beta-L-altropyranose hydrolase, partial [Campylobacterota bacterium]|nr:UDP-2,4-diacetamido-2,4,6-trideoxy-beta-L-altropyranose hydrolase [Campylobacterota bacterium]